MSLNFQPYQDTAGQEVRARWGRSLDDIFNAYLQSKQNARQEMLQNRQIADAEGAQLAGQGFLNRQVTPEVLQQAQNPTIVPGAPPMLARSPELAQPQAQYASSIAEAVAKHFKTRQEAQALSAQEKKANIAKDFGAARKENAQAGFLEGANGQPQVQTIGGVQYLVHPSMNGPQYSAIPERVPSQNEQVARGYADKAQQAHDTLSTLEKSGYQPSQVGNAFQSLAPTAMQSPQYQQLDQSRRQFINAVLRRESGAAISASEYDNYTRQYFPVAGDSPQVLQQKAKSRQLAIQGLATEGKRVPSNLPSKANDPLGIL